MFLIVWNSAAKAQQESYIIAKLPCGNTPSVLKMLEGEYSELPIGSGSSKGAQISLYASHHANGTQTWTLIITKDNTSCVMKGGQDWIVNPVIIKGDPS